MRKLPIVLVLAALAALHAVPAHAQATRSQTYKITVTIPASAGMSTVSDRAGQQAIQTAQVVRENRPIMLKSIVVP